VTRRAPWAEVENPMQITGLVGYEGRRLAVPFDAHPALQRLMRACFADAAARPTFDAVCKTLEAELRALRSAAADAEIPDEFFCPISFEVMTDPVVAADGHTYGRKTIEEWFGGGNHSSPLTNVPLRSIELVPNHALRALIRKAAGDA
jgi:hypothetical protein